MHLVSGIFDGAKNAAKDAADAAVVAAKAQATQARQQRKAQESRVAGTTSYLPVVIGVAAVAALGIGILVALRRSGGK